MKSHKLYIQALTTVFAVLLPLMPASYAVAQSTDVQATKVYLPYVASTANVNNSADEAEALVQRLNEKYVNEGFNFFVLKAEGEQVKASGVYTTEISSFTTSNLLQISSEEELGKLVDSIYNAKQQSAEAKHAGQAETEEALVQAALLTTIPKTETWYGPLTGSGAPYLPSYLCFKNITYTYQIDDVLRKITNPKISSSALTGLPIALSWAHDGAVASMINLKAASLQVKGHYTLGVQQYGINIGFSWNDTWLRTVTPSCAICK